MADKGTIVCLLNQEFEDSEFRIPTDRLGSAGFRVEIVGLKAGTVLKGHKGIESVTVDRRVEDAHAHDYIAMVIPGGHSPDYLRLHEKVVEFVKEFDETGKPLAAVCHGPQLLLAAGLVRGRTVTAWPTVQRDLEEAGALVKDQKVVVDRNWITSRKPDDLEAFSDKIIEEIAEWVERSAGRADTTNPHESTWQL